jgi:hypothetical protein
MQHRDSLDTLRLHRGAEHLHQLGARATAELLAEVAERIGGWPLILATLTEYERLTPGMVRKAGADRFPPRPIRQVA